MMFLSLLAAVPMPATPLPLIPEPVSVVRAKGQFTLDSHTVIVCDSKLIPTAEQLQAFLRPATGYRLPIESKAPSDFIELKLNSKLGKLGPEGYTLSSGSKGVTIESTTSAGAFYGVQTLRQLLPTDIFRPATVHEKWTVPAVEITDYPRFGWRGAMLDVCRHFMPKEFVLKFLDLMALHKLNTFHWHLTDDQGWRIQIKRYPKLTSVGAYRDNNMLVYDPPTYDGKAEGGFYTQDEIKDVVAYAAKLHINVVPEIEMPGHSQAAIAAYPELGNTGLPLKVRVKYGVSEHTLNMKDSTVKFMENVLDEVMALFPSKFIHVGGDEAPTTEWAASPEAQAKMKQLGITDPRGLQTWYTHQIDDYLTAYGRRLVGWDEILEGGTLAKGATVMSWRGEQGGIAAAKLGHDVVMTPSQYTYLDHYQLKDTSLEPHCIGGYLPLETVYNYNPAPKELTDDERKFILGSDCQLWTEYVIDPKHAEFRLFPRVCAFSEVVWSPESEKDFANFMLRLPTHMARLKDLDVNACPLNPANLGPFGYK